MKRIRQTIEVSEPLWRALELMSRDMGVDRDALVAQALFQLARQNGYVSPTVVPLGGEAQGGAGASVPVAQAAASVVQAAAPVVQVTAPVPQVAAPVAVTTGVAAPPVVVPVAPVAPPATEAVETAPAAAVAAVAVLAPVAPVVDTPSVDEPTEDPATEPPGVTAVPSVVAPMPSPALVLARMQEILAEVEASVAPSEGLAAESDEESDDDADEDDSDDDADEGSDDDSDEDEDSDEDDSDDDADEDSEDDSDDADEDSEDDAAEAASADADASDEDDLDDEPSDDSEAAAAADDSDDDAGASAGGDGKRDVSSDDIAAELAALGVVEDPTDAALPEAPVATPVAARPLVARPIPKLRPPDEAATILEDQSAETTNIVKAPAPLEVFVRWAQGTPVAISTERFTIGRGPRCSLVVRSERVSREHAVVTRVGDEVFIEDLNSSNGTWLNNERITKHQVSDGDEYMLGTESVSFTMRPAGG
ncbi:FHA domain-containing protein [Myxococcus sp. 1LA]